MATNPTDDHHTLLAKFGPQSFMTPDRPTSRGLTSPTKTSPEMKKLTTLMHGMSVTGNQHHLQPSSSQEIVGPKFAKLRPMSEVMDLDMTTAPKLKRLRKTYSDAYSTRAHPGSSPEPCEFPDRFEGSPSRIAILSESELTTPKKHRDSPRPPLRRSGNLTAETLRKFEESLNDGNETVTDESGTLMK